MKHKKYEEVKTLVSSNMPVLLEGEAGSGKSTIVRQLAEDLSLDFYAMSLTKQTTMNALLGFISINGTYIPSALRLAVEQGGIMLLDEINAADPNTLLCLNTLENGYLACPDKVVKVHENFRLTATANPTDNVYTGRSKLDGATLDRFDKVIVGRDHKLEEELVGKSVSKIMDKYRAFLEDYGRTKVLSMRDAIRYKKRQDLGLITDDYLVGLLGGEEMLMTYNDRINTQELMSVDSSVPNNIVRDDIRDLWESITS